MKNKWIALVLAGTCVFGCTTAVMAADTEENFISSYNMSSQVSFDINWKNTVEDILDFDEDGTADMDADTEEVWEELCETLNLDRTTTWTISAETYSDPVEGFYLCAENEDNSGVLVFSCEQTGCPDLTAIVEELQEDFGDCDVEITEEDGCQYLIATTETEESTCAVFCLLDENGNLYNFSVTAAQEK